MAEETKVGRHGRQAWGHPGDAAVRVHADLATMKGKTAATEGERAELLAITEAAKRGADSDAAAALITRLFNEETEDRLVDAIIAADAVPIIVAPYPAFDDEDGDGYRAPSRGPINMIPFTYAAYLAERFGADHDDQIVQAARVGRSKLGPFPRFLWQPKFNGEVYNRPYILADDVFTMGGTLAALRNHIVEGGGTVIGVTTLAHKDGFDQPFAIRKETLSQLYGEYGAGIGELWMEIVGHDPECLSENEGQTLIRFALTEAAGGDGVARLYALRGRLAEAAAKGE